MLELIDVSKFYGATAAVEKLSLRMERGRTTVLLGPSGCGKSTLLRLLVGLITPDGGSVRFDGEEVRSDNLPLLRRRIGYVIQDGGLFPHLTGRGNVSLMAGQLGWKRERIDRRIGELAGLTKFPLDGLDRYPAQLSGGQRQRISIMRALMLDPEVLLLDEPLGALDPMIRVELQEELHATFQRLKKTVVMITHDVAEADFFGDVVVLMRDGRIVQQGTLDEFLDHPAEPFVTRFINAQRPAISKRGGNAR